MIEITNFDDAVDYAMELIGSDFEASLKLANAILADPSSYTGPQAAATAQKMAAHRYKIGVVAQQWKIKSSQTKRMQDRLVKDSLMVAYDAIEEIINTLKLAARADMLLATSR